MELILPGLYRCPSPQGGCNSYLLLGQYKNVLIDPGLDTCFPHLEAEFLSLGLKPRDIDIVIDTHEHFDHMGANLYFEDFSLIGAHHSAAVKIGMRDRFVTLYQSLDPNAPPPRVHLWLEDKFRLDLGDFLLEVVHTPGHTSGSLCLYELKHGLLFTGDTVFARGTLSYIGESGSVGDYIYSISRLNMFQVNILCPGHGDLSTTPTRDMEQAMGNALRLLEEEPRGATTARANQCPPRPMVLHE